MKKIILNIVVFLVIALCTILSSNEVDMIIIAIATIPFVLINGGKNGD